MPASLRRRPDKVRNAARQRSGSLLLCGVPFYFTKRKNMLEVTGIEKRYRGRTILKDVSFRANPGNASGLCGRKWMMARRRCSRLLAGIRKPDRGSIRIDGQEALGRHRLLEEKIAYVPQENPLIPELTAFDNYRLVVAGGNGGKWSGIWNAASVVCWAWTDS